MPTHTCCSGHISVYIWVVCYLVVSQFVGCSRMELRKKRKRSGRGIRILCWPSWPFTNHVRDVVLHCALIDWPDGRLFTMAAAGQCCNRRNSPFQSAQVYCAWIHLFRAVSSQGSINIMLMLSWEKFMEENMMENQHSLAKLLFHLWG